MLSFRIAVWWCQWVTVLTFIRPAEPLSVSPAGDSQRRDGPITERGRPWRVICQLNTVR